MEAVRPATSASARSVDQRPSGRRQQFFSAKSHAAVWRVLRAGLLRAEGVILVTGSEGSGKTSLLKRLSGMIPDNRDLAQIAAADQPDAHFLHHLIAATALPKGDAGALIPVDPEIPTSHIAEPRTFHPAWTLQDLVDAMEERVAMGRKLVLVVDDAHLLNPEPLAWLDMMARFVSEGVKPIQLILSGRSEMRTLLESESGPGLAELIVGSCEVTPLTRGEVWDYLAVQLERSLGWPVKVSWFAWVEIYGYSQGNPLKIDQLLRRLLPIARQKSAKVVNRSMVRLAMTMGRAMHSGSLFRNAPPKVRAAILAGGVTLLALVGYGAGLFDSSSDSSQPVAARKGESGENTTYVKLPDVGSSANPASKSDKGERPEKTSAPAKDVAKPADDKNDEKGSSKKKYWEPNMPIRPDGPMPHPAPERPEPGLAALSKPASEPITLARAPASDPEAFRKRYQSAKALSGAVPEEGSGAAPPEGGEPAQPAEGKKNTPPLIPPVVKGSRTAPVPEAAAPRPASEPHAMPPGNPEGESDAQSAANKEGGVRVPPPPRPPAPPLQNLRAAAPARESGERSGKPPSAKPSPQSNQDSHETAPLPRITGVATEKNFRAVGRVFVVQVGSFSNQESADQLKRTLSGPGRDLYVHLYQKQNRRIYSVRMNYRTKDPADRMAQTIQQQRGLATKVMELNYD
ncbi:MAG: AAA family ATPase [Magnetococcales bacterium]|nr:AAA family ATPase [Magnetococcales bacterium]NGZ06215.1 AAA family ATPase [Magnetococcales bacterium]